MQYLAVKVRLHPTAEQKEQIEKTFHTCRYLWNKMLSDVQEFYAATDIHYIPTPARYKTEAPFLREIDSQALTTVHQQLRKVFLDFFRNPASFQYPKFKTKDADANLSLIPVLQKRCGCKVGYSGHERDIGPSVLSVAAGASSIERHITLDKTMYGSDQKASLEPEQLRTLVREVRRGETIMGSGEKILSEAEQIVRYKLRG